jgi:Fe-S cluster biogenesis protein NfuA
MSQIPITVYVEMTPNPNTMKFVANKYLLISGESVEFTSQAETKGYSPLAEELFSFPFVKGVFFAANFVTITKNESISWDFVTMELREFIKNWLADGKDVIVMMPPVKAKSEDESKPSKTYEPSEYDDAIRDLLDEYVRPAVENDGGAIDFVGYEDGTVTVALRGSCSGCPSSTATLKGGIENLLKSHLPEVKEVVAESL